ncbi:MAG: hypothetical protein IJV00_03270 [Clostridia bacterium]|nr:hypothetical protein [Clostridia bacterium]
MEKLIFSESACGAKFKILNATNGGPWHKRHANDQYRTNFEDYKAARFQYSRNHDSASCGVYGGPYSHDISCIFPNFDADVNDPTSYDFACTDESILIALDAGVKTFFRLGQTIEHQIVKHNVFPPKDFKKWAEICEHIILHYNYGWADGMKLGIEYWEIWNEPDLDDGSEYKRTWTGTRAQFFDLYEITAKHLKGLFPELKIGGPALCGRFEWGEDFLNEMSKRNVPIDFFSWHRYNNEPEKFFSKERTAREMIDKYGYTKAESILNEWNYIRDWKENFVYSLEAIHGAKGAAFTAAVIVGSQDEPVDMLMYYDTRPSVFCGAFDIYTYRKLKGYYPFLWYGKFYDLESQVKLKEKPKHVEAICGEAADGKRLVMLSYYREDDSAPGITLSVDPGKKGKFEAFLVDPDHDGESVGIKEDLVFELKPQSVMLLKEI